MCGIAGFVGTPDHGRLRDMAASLRRRGPDDEGFVIFKDASLATRRLALVDVANGHQPLTNEDGSIAVAFNGEIFNANKLRRELLACGHRIETRCDTEVLPHLYEERGDDFVDALEGEFAIAIWDNRRRRLLLTRDRSGVKPLYYCEDGPDFLFASEIKGIIAGLRRRPPLSLEAIYHYLSFKHVPNPGSVYRGILAVRPAEQLVFARQRIEARRYWRWPLTTDARQICHTAHASAKETEEERIDALDTLLNESVATRLCADQPVGALLSGGLDSSLIVAIARRHTAATLNTFTMTYSDGVAHKNADTLAARAVADRFNTQHHEYRLDAGDFRESLPSILTALDEPFAGVMSTFFISRLVSQFVKACLSGDGADEQFGSYLAHRLAQPLDVGRQSGIGAAREHPSFAALSGADAEQVVRLAGMGEAAARASLLVFTDVEKRELLNPDYRAFADFSTEALVRKTYDNFACGDSQTRAQLFDCQTLLPDQVLVFNDRLSMAHSVEVRVPFLAHPFVERVTALPGDWKIRGGVCKWGLKQLARRYLPAEIIDRPKEGFVPPINQWQREALAPLIVETLSANRLAAHGLFRADRVESLLRRYQSGARDLQYKIWSLFCFQMWHDHVYRAAPATGAVPEKRPYSSYSGFVEETRAAAEAQTDRPAAVITSDANAERVSTGELHA